MEHNPSGIVFTLLAALPGMERAYTCDRTLEGQGSGGSRPENTGKASSLLNTLAGTLFG
ncbi:hypothetical protein [Saccharopolyspora spinosa]|uniref:Uncharacterized protein n=1 Tax=Saccharopolyspora spinosa TaxID=60894 RepID=A0A2N3Y6S5_SACSN|nr:hypothetical protein [Saccharopolyspora spinosa]PKW18610.1 hypothetical protein A8926_6713 [Saccharopolyspora spinosa]